MYSRNKNGTYGHQTLTKYRQTDTDTHTREDCSVPGGTAAQLAQECFVKSQGGIPTRRALKRDTQLLAADVI